MGIAIGYCSVCGKELMVMRIETRKQIEQAILGGAFFGGGGGGFLSLARKLSKDILSTGCLEILSPKEISPESLVATVSFLGAPGASGTHITPDDQLRCLSLFESHLGKKVDAFISCENGAVSTINGWLLSAATGKPVLDAPADGRAHPTGIMGSLGLERKKGYQTIQAFVGGDAKKGKHLEGVIKGTIETTAPVVRSAAASANGLIIVIRHPVSASYAIRHGAPGAIRDALIAGEIIQTRSRHGGINVANALTKKFGGIIMANTRAVHFDMLQEKGFDKGYIRMQSGHTLFFLNEYLAVNINGKREASFPDIIFTLNAESGIPLSSGEIMKGAPLILGMIPKKKLKLGAGVRNLSNYKICEDILGISLIKYARKTG
ncbi:DUF917 family protein [Candidatus Sumerlaeota bacterium]|nr:DUF917 family protein [Candidatus Sumerlaeota bacterium]